MSIIRRAVSVVLVQEPADLHDPGVVDQHVHRARAALRRRPGTARTSRARSRPGSARPRSGRAPRRSCAPSRGRGRRSPRACPARVSACAVARPIPRAAPVIAAVWPARMRALFGHRDAMNLAHLRRLHGGFQQTVDPADDTCLRPSGAVPTSRTQGKRARIRANHGVARIRVCRSAAACLPRPRSTRVATSQPLGPCTSGVCARVDGVG